ncbi:MAG TPA: hypothetical protein VF552_00025 [Allosphingosinicella sp.]
MIVAAFLLLQAAAQPQAQAAPDIQLDIGLTARRVTVERRGEASLDVRAGPDGGSVVNVEAPEGNGSRTLRNVNVRVRAEARIADPASAAAAASAEIDAEAETRQPE